MAELFCNQCGQKIPEESRFCNKCGAAQGGDAPDAKPALKPGERHKEEEKDMWKGTFSSKALGHWWLLWLIWAVGLIIAYAGALPPETKAQSWPLYVLAGATGVPLLMIVWVLLSKKLTVRYRLSTHRLFKEVGFISRDMDEVELVRVDDVSVSQNLIQRIFNVGNVTVISTDATHPRLGLEGIHNPIEIKETIRNQVRKWRDQALHMESL